MGLAAAIRPPVTLPAAQKLCQRPRAAPPALGCALGALASEGGGVQIAAIACLCALWLRPGSWNVPVPRLMCCNRVAGFLRRLNGFAATSGWFYRSTVDDARRPLVPPDRPGRRRACARGVPRPAPPVPLLCPLTGPDNAGPAPVVCPGPRPQCRCSADGPARLVAGLLRRGAPPPPLRGDGSTGVAVLAAVGVWWGGEQVGTAFRARLPHHKTPVCRWLFLMVFRGCFWLAFRRPSGNSAGCRK